MDNQLFYDISEFLIKEKKSLKDKIQPFVKKFLERENIFFGPFRLAFDIEFNNFILKLLKSEVMERFNLNIEEVEIIVDKEFLTMLELDKWYFKKEVYIENKNTI